MTTHATVSRCEVTRLQPYGFHTEFWNQISEPMHDTVRHCEEEELQSQEIRKNYRFFGHGFLYEITKASLGELNHRRSRNAPPITTHVHPLYLHPDLRHHRWPQLPDQPRRFPASSTITHDGSFTRPQPHRTQLLRPACRELLTLTIPFISWFLAVAAHCPPKPNAGTRHPAPPARETLTLSLGIRPQLIYWLFRAHYSLLYCIDRASARLPAPHSLSALLVEIPSHLVISTCIFSIIRHHVGCTIINTELRRFKHRESASRFVTSSRGAMW